MPTSGKANTGRRVDLASGPVDWKVTVAPERLVAECLPRNHPSVTDLEEAVRRAIAQPLGFPPLEQAIYPNDRVVIAVDGSPAAYRTVLGPLIEIARRRGARAEDIVVVAPHRARPHGRAIGDFAARVEFHNPDDQSQLSYLASTEEGDRIYLNRTVVDADVLILVGAVRYDPVLGYRGTSSAVFPALSTTESYQRFVSSFTGRSLGHHPRWARDYVDQVAWLLGAQFCVQLVPGAQTAVAGVLAGNLSAVQQAAEKLLDQTLSFQVPRRAELVVATVSRGGRQSMAELARAAFTARQVIRKGGRIVLLSDTDHVEGPTLERTRRAADVSEILSYLRHHTPPDAVTAFMHATACRDATVYLRSNLNEDLVEELFMYPLHHADQLQRLIDQAESLIVLHEANRLRVSVTD